MDQESSVGIATGYWLDGPGMDSKDGGVFHTFSHRPFGPLSLL